MFLDIAQVFLSHGTWALLSEIIALAVLDITMNKKILSALIVGVVVVGGGAFYGGMVYAKTKGPAGAKAMFANMSIGDRQARFVQLGDATSGQNGTRTMRAGGGMAAGEIISKDDKSITVKLGDGGSKIIFYTDKTPVTKTINGTLDELKTGAQVIVNGTANQDGSITAESVALRPAITVAPVK